MYTVPLLQCADFTVTWAHHEPMGNVAAVAGSKWQVERFAHNFVNIAEVWTAGCTHSLWMEGALCRASCSCWGSAHLAGHVQVTS